MGDLSHIAYPGRNAISVPIPSQWRDHHFQGQPILPAVEAMALLATHLDKAAPQYDVRTITQARFGKFLPIDPAAEHVDVFIDVTDGDENGCHAALLTKTVTKSGISRNIEHAGMRFGRQPIAPEPLPMDLIAALDGICRHVDPETIYRELVPFGPAFRSIRVSLAISESGAMAEVQAFEHPGFPDNPHLGSIFPLDGAFHAACVWGQRYAGIVAFPVGIRQRTVVNPTRSGETYTARVIPVKIDGPALIFDIHILDHSGNLRDIAAGVEMRDVSRGRWVPPNWIARRDNEAAVQSEFDQWLRYCSDVVMIERTQVADFAPLALSSGETARMTTMGGKRRNGYVSARLACKRLWRRMAGPLSTQPADEIETITASGPQPVLPPLDGQRAFWCAVSHDDAYTIAVAHTAPIGVDVEKISSRAHRCRRLFMTAAEQSLTPPAIDPDEIAVRIWTVKEAAAKALNLSLAEAWHNVEVIEMTDSSSQIRAGAETIVSAYHITHQGHVFTMIPFSPEGTKQ